MSRRYIAGIVPEQGSGFSVYFPDVPSVVVGGETLEEALDNAASGLCQALKEIAERNEDAPAPSGMVEARAAVAVAREQEGLPCPEDTLYQYIEAPAWT